MGASRIILLGYNMGVRGKAHFFGDHPKGLTNGNYGGFVGAFTALAKGLESEGVEVINCTKDSALTQFPAGDLSAILNCG